MLFLFHAIKEKYINILKELKYYLKNKLFQIINNYC